MIPSKLPKGTTLEQWERYEKELQSHKAFFEGIKPLEQDFKTLNAFYTEMDKWRFEKTLDAPNKPGSYRANND